MIKRPFVALIVIDAYCFVPVLFYFGVGGFVIPLSGGLVVAMQVGALLPVGYLVYAAFYVAVFYSMARGLNYAAQKIRSRSARLGLQTCVLTGLLTCSFARVITYGSIQGSGGIYTFWTAIERFCEKRSHR